MALPLCGWILTKLGWAAVFYVSGILALTWFFAWYFLTYDSPDEHPRISLKEKQFLEKRIPKIEPKNVCTYIFIEKKLIFLLKYLILKKFRFQQALPVPWLSIFTSLQFWVGGVAAIGNDWGFHTFCTFGPKYIKGALGFDLEQVNIN